MKLSRLFYVLLAILTLPSFSAAQEQSQWKETPDGRTGPITIIGTELTGKLFADMVGTVSITEGGYLFLGYWNDDFVTGCGPSNGYAGPMGLLFDSSGSSFVGGFGYCRENTTHDDLAGRTHYTGTLQSGSLDFSGISGGGSGTGTCGG